MKEDRLAVAADQEDIVILIVVNNLSTPLFGIIYNDIQTYSNQVPDKYEMIYILFLINKKDQNTYNFL